MLVKLAYLIYSGGSEGYILLFYLFCITYSQFICLLIQVGLPLFNPFWGLPTLDIWRHVPDSPMCYGRHGQAES